MGCDFLELSDFKPGESVYVIYRNPHIQNVASVQKATVVEDPNNHGELCIYLYETYYPNENGLAIFESESAAQDAFNYYFGLDEKEEI